MSHTLLLWQWASPLIIRTEQLAASWQSTLQSYPHSRSQVSALWQSIAQSSPHDPAHASASWHCQPQLSPQPRSQVSMLWQSTSQPTPAQSYAQVGTLSQVQCRTFTAHFHTIQETHTEKNIGKIPLQHNARHIVQRDRTRSNLIERNHPATRLPVGRMQGYRLTLRILNTSPERI